MKKIFYILTAALLTVTGCTVDDTAIDNNAAKTVTFTATLAPKGGASRDQSRACSSFGETQPALAEGKGGDDATRAITTGTEGGKEVLTTAWKSGEKIALYYQTGPDTYAKVEATVGTPNADGSAPITATLTGAIDGGTVKFVYPASLMDKSGDIKWSSIRINQKGYLTTPETGSGSGQGQSTVDLGSITTISNNFDLATATGTIAVTGTEASVSGKVKMENQVCICKFNISLTDADATVTHYDITIAFEGGETYQLKEIPKDRLNELYVAMRPVSSALAIITAEGYQSSGSGISSSSPTIISTHFKYINSVTLDAGKFYRNVPVTLYKNYNTLTAETGEMTLLDGEMLKGNGGSETRLKIADGAVVYLRDVDNTYITQKASIPGIECLGDATIILAGTNRVTGRWNAPGIFVPEGKTLTIKGGGTLNATGGSNGAGIGGTNNVSCGNIVIASGTITATGTGHCAGIGSGRANGANNTCGNITISGGTVTATGGGEAAGIGSGNAGSASNACGDITISGGTVTATGGDCGAGIGSGYAKQASNTCDNITISGGTVTATGGRYAAGIGSGNGNNYTQDGENFTLYVSACGAISITGGTIEATGGNDAAGIGSGSYGRFASISIGSGITRVTATRSNNYFNVPIGKGYGDQGKGAVTFGYEIMYNGNGDGWDSNFWTNWLETGGPFGGIQVSASDYGSNNGRTWTLTPTH